MIGASHGKGCSDVRNRGQNRRRGGSEASNTVTVMAQPRRCRMRARRWSHRAGAAKPLTSPHSLFELGSTARSHYSGSVTARCSISWKSDGARHERACRYFVRGQLRCIVATQNRVDGSQTRRRDNNGDDVAVRCLVQEVYDRGARHAELMCHFFLGHALFVVEPSRPDDWIAIELGRNR